MVSVQTLNLTDGKGLTSKHNWEVNIYSVYHIQYIATLDGWRVYTASTLSKIGFVIEAKELRYQFVGFTVIVWWISQYNASEIALWHHQPGRYQRKYPNHKQADSYNMMQLKLIKTNCEVNLDYMGTWSLKMCSQHKTTYTWHKQLHNRTESAVKSTIKKLW